MSDAAYRYSPSYQRHAICDACWIVRTTRQRRPGDPIRVPGEIEACCFCGVFSASGIYVRECSDPTKLDAATHCRGH